MNVVETTRHNVKTAMMVPSRVAGLSKLDCNPAGGFPAGPFRSASFFAGGNDPGGASSMVLMAMCKLQDNGYEREARKTDDDERRKTDFRLSARQKTRDTITVQQQMNPI